MNSYIVAVYSVTGMQSKKLAVAFQPLVVDQIWTRLRCRNALFAKDPVTRLSLKHRTAACGKYLDNSKFLWSVTKIKTVTAQQQQ